jgi:hypothetical protein
MGMNTATIGRVVAEWAGPALFAGVLIALAVFFWWLL